MTHLWPVADRVDLAQLNKRKRAAHEPTWFETHARPSQRPPEGDWRFWLILAGRGWGKTRTIVEWAKQQARLMPGSFGALVAATSADTRDVLVEGESGFLATSTDADRPRYEPSKRRLTWPNGSRATLFSADEPDRLRGPQHHWAIADELAAWRYPEAWAMLMFGLRLGQDPRVAIATTPRPVPLIRNLLANPSTVTTRGTTYENQANLAPAFFEEIIREYEGTRLGRQELNAELLDDVPGALWTRATLDEYRVRHAPDLTRIVVGIDPAATSGEESAETGIIVAGLGADGHGYVLQDVSLRDTPARWGEVAVHAYDRHEANRIVVETNQGGDMVEHVIKTAARDLYRQDKRPSPVVPIRKVRASRGKATRAEPIAALYEQGRVHHVGSFAALEDQLCTWVPGEASPDRLDALVWALSDLMLRPVGEATGRVDFNAAYRGEQL